MRNTPQTGVLVNRAGLRDYSPVKTKSAKKQSTRKRGAKEVRIRGKRVPSFGGEFVVVRTGRFPASRGHTKSSEEAHVLVRKAGKALARPGISRSVVFRRSGGAFAYSVDPQNPERIVRLSADGKRSVGRLVDGRFKAN